MARINLTRPDPAKRARRPSLCPLLWRFGVRPNNGGGYPDICVHFCPMYEIAIPCYEELPPNECRKVGGFLEDCYEHVKSKVEELEKKGKNRTVYMHRLLS